MQIPPIRVPWLWNPLKIRYLCRLFPPDPAKGDQEEVH